MYMVKTFKNLFLQNLKSYDLETWHVALGTQALQNLNMDDDPGFTFAYFTARSNGTAYTFEWGNKALERHLMGGNLQQMTILTEKC